MPTTDIFALGNRLVIRIELAGVDPEEVDLRFANGVLTVSGNRTADLDTDEEPTFYVRERFYGAFRRSITLPEGTQREPDPCRVRRRAGGDRRRGRGRGFRVHPDPAAGPLRRGHHPVRGLTRRPADGAAQAVAAAGVGRADVSHSATCTSPTSFGPTVQLGWRWKTSVSWPGMIRSTSPERYSWIWP